MNFTAVILGILFLACGILIAAGKLHTHLSAWKHMSQQERSKIKVRPLCLNIGEIVMLNGIIFMLKGLISNFTDHWFTLAIVAWMIVAGFDAWYISKSGKYAEK